MRQAQQDHWRTRATRLTCVLTCAASLLAAGCAATRTLAISDQEPTQAALPRISGGIAVYVSEELRGYVGVSRVNSLLTVNAPLGERAVAILSRLLGEMFEHLEVLSAWPSKTVLSPGIALVLVPRIESFSLIRGPGLPGEARIGLVVDVYDRDGRKVDHLEFVGIARSSGASYQQLTDDEGTVQSALRDVVAQLLVRLLALQVLDERVRGGSSATRVGHMPVVPSERQTGTRVALASKSSTGDDKCVSTALADVAPHLNIVPAATFRELLYPWWEASTAPKDDSQTEQLFKRDYVVKRMRDAGLQFMLAAQIVTSGVSIDPGSLICGGGAGIGGCFGSATGERETNVAIDIWNMGNGTKRAAIAATEKGKSWAIGLIIPVWHNARTENEACMSAARQVADILRQ